MIEDNSLKTRDILFKLVAFDRFRLTLLVNINNMYFSLQNNLLILKKPRFP